MSFCRWFKLKCNSTTFSRYITNASRFVVLTVFSEYICSKTRANWAPAISLSLPIKFAFPESITNFSVFLTICKPFRVGMVIISPSPLLFLYSHQRKIYLHLRPALTVSMKFPIYSSRTPLSNLFMYRVPPQHTLAWAMHLSHFHPFDLMPIYHNLFSFFTSRNI